MMSNQTIYCVECLRVLVTSGTTSLAEARYGPPGTNDMYGAHRPVEARYVVDGTWYCTTHALPVYQAAPTHVILEDA